MVRRVGNVQKVAPRLTYSFPVLAVRVEIERETGMKSEEETLSKS